jgi:hypothetical protein
VPKESATRKDANYNSRATTKSQAVIPEADDEDDFDRDATMKKNATVGAKKR